MIEPPKIILDASEIVGEDQIPLILLAPTGIVYTAQCGGVGCTHPEAEGFVIGLRANFEQEINDCTYGCAHLSDQDEGGRKLREKLARDLHFFLFEASSDWNFKIEFDFERIDLLQEGWWPVVVIGEFDKFYGTHLNHKGFIHIGNCD